MHETNLFFLSYLPWCRRNLSRVLQPRLCEQEDDRTNIRSWKGSQKNFFERTPM